MAIFLVLRNSPEMGNHGELCSRPKYKARNIKRHHHPRVLPSAETESQNICFAKNKRKNRNRTLLLGLQATINKRNLLISQKRASPAGLLTQDCSSWAKDAILINHRTDEKPLLLLGTFPCSDLLRFSLTWCHRYQRNTEKVWSVEALLWYIPLALPTKPESGSRIQYNFLTSPLLQAQRSPPSIFSAGALLIPRTLGTVRVSPHTIRDQIWTLQCFLEHPELSSESQTNTLIAFNLSASNHSV